MLGVRLELNPPRGAIFLLHVPSVLIRHGEYHPTSRENYQREEFGSRS